MAKSTKPKTLEGDFDSVLRSALRVPPECKHCWHEIGVVVTLWPPMKELVCCHCGVLGKLRGKEFIPEGCGPYHPRDVSFDTSEVKIG